MTGTDSGTDKGNKANARDDGQQPQAGLIAQYVRDLSFENPNAPNSMQNFAQDRPDIAINVNVGARRLAEEGFEVELKIEATAKKQE
ncbi:MAG: preprotein translocase subunit SecB, partial [Alphaproteobacteria bacterium]